MIFPGKERLIRKLLKVIYYVVHNRQIKEREILEYLEYVKKVDDETDMES